jgi:hypothetical protein
MKHAVIALVVAFGLSGCDAAKELGSAVSKTMDDNKSHQMTLVIPSGYKMIVGGQQAKVYGAEECPPASDFVKFLFGPDPDEGVKSCVVIAPDTKTVTVTVGLPSGASKETWAVERKDDRVMLRRADGSLLAASE